MNSPPQEVLTRILRKGMTPLLVFDFDGTLSPIVENPEEAQISPEALSLLKRLSSIDRVITGIMSGRSLEDVKKRVPLPLPVWGGNHGAEVEVLGETRILIDTSRLEALKEFGKVLSSLPLDERVLVEDKKFSISVHTRRVSPEEEKEVQALLRERVKAFPGLAWRRGKRVFEVFPSGAPGKGKALFTVKKILEEKRKETYYPFYFGDDVTDKNVYEEMKKRGCGHFTFVEGGREVSPEGDHIVNGIDGLQEVMEKIVAALKGSA
ncbi:MAG: trehalose-phosphatase [Deltaproteobacteria bacterium]|nr:MAG: trehalose-phosphatase [Deltaproteobacteria bacterium]